VAASASAAFSASSRRRQLCGFRQQGVRDRVRGTTCCAATWLQRRVETLVKPSERALHGISELSDRHVLQARYPDASLVFVDLGQHVFERGYGPLDDPVANPSFFTRADSLGVPLPRSSRALITVPSASPIMPPCYSGWRCPHRS
jgi:hypothetical protein